MEKRLMFGLVLILIVIVAVLLVFQVEQPNAGRDYYSENPDDWISTSKDGYRIDVNKVTGNRGYSSGTDIQINDGIIQTGFSHEGWFHDVYFTNEFSNTTDTILRVSPIMDPDDGIIDVYIVEDIIEGNPKTMIFVDEDWKNRIKPTNIVWGATYSNFRSFQYTMVKPGIYMDTIQDERSRFNEDFTASRGGVAVGNLTLENIQTEETSNLVFVRI